jgi:hypothetical protein
MAEAIIERSPSDGSSEHTHKRRSILPVAVAAAADPELLITQDKKLDVLNGQRKEEMPAA